MFGKIRLINLTMLLLMLWSPLNAQTEPVKYEFVESSRTIMRAGSNQNLTMLVQQLYPNKQKFWPRLEQEIRKINPHGFNRYTGKIIPGQRIKLITMKIIRKSYVLTQNVVGEVQSLKGSVSAIDSRGNKRRLEGKADLYEGDRLLTDKDSTVVVKMMDDAEIHLKQDSSVRITEYKMKSGFEKGSRSILDLIKGGLKTLTGAIGANPLSVYRFQTGVVTIGVRGTEYVAMLCESNDCKKTSGRNDANAFLHVVVLDGLISLQDEEGTVGELIMGQYAVATSETKVIINDAPPAYGLLSADEQKLFKDVKLKSDEKEKKKPIWPWLLGGALLGL